MRMSTTDRWYENAVIYGVDVETYYDGNGDGFGDFQGLTQRLDYLERLGVSCLWVLPFFPSPDRDNGYDVRDYYGVDPRLGTLGDFVEFLRAARDRGIRVLIDLVVNHTSDEHPWFQAARDPDSPYHDYYIWVDEPPEETEQKPIFPDEEDSVWTYDERAGRWYFHEFYHFQPSLNHTNPRVREEVRRIMGFWLELGVDGFRVDAASHLIEARGPARPEDPHGLLRQYARFAGRRRGDAVLMGETDVEPDRLAEFFGDGDELHLLFNFLLNNYFWLAMARENAEPLVQGMELLPAPPQGGQWANFLRNLDEVDLERLTEAQRQAVYDAFAPEERMRIFDRGIRRRLAPMVGGDRRRIELAYSLLFSLPGTPLLVYGDEIGMGEDLELPGRRAVRTAMQWSDDPNGGFSRAPADRLGVPVIDEGEFGFREVNVAEQHRDRDSLLTWMERMIRTRRECPELGRGACEVIETGCSAVFAHRCRRDEGEVVAVHNLSGEPVSVRLPLPEDEASRMVHLIGDRRYEEIDPTNPQVELPPFGYRWMRRGGLGAREDRS